MNKFFIYLSDTAKGLLIMLAGTILLLNTLGITARVIHLLIICCSVFMIFYGFVKSGLYNSILDKIKNKPEIQP